MPSTAVYLVLPAVIAAIPCVLDVLRCVEIRLSGTQPDHILACGLQLGCFWVTAMVGDGFTRARVLDSSSISASV